MHFHLPKPLHGWREFTGEVGIIVIGVLIALGAEQVVETIHWRERAAKADTALRDELIANYVFADEAVVAAPCIDRQLQALELRLVGTRGSYVPAPMYQDKSGAFTFRAPGRPWTDEIWNSVVAEGLASRFDQQFRDNLSALYGQVRIMRENELNTDLLGWRLRVLSQPANFDGATRARLAEEIEEARGRFEFNALVGNQIIGRLQSIDRAPPQKLLAGNRAQSGTITFCRAHGLPLGKVEPEKP